ncbi:MAG: Rid family detoxifying hydrolase [Bdellovibrionales bacterium]|nr:Rid family detoxifying hydrolase [Bdellovibrionales bacterium]
MKSFNGIANAPTPVGPYSQATEANGLLFLAGQVGLEPQTGALVPGGVREQTEQVLKNLDAVLRGAGSAPERILLTTIFLADMADFPTVNEVYGHFVSSDAPPARQTVAVKQLPLGALVEISVIAAAIGA